jgi:hypothetical protein
MAPQCSNRPTKFCVSKPTPCWYYSNAMKALSAERGANNRVCNENIGYWTEVLYHVRKFPFQWFAKCWKSLLCCRKNNIILCTSKASSTHAHEVPGSALRYSVPASGSTAPYTETFSQSSLPPFAIHLFWFRYSTVSLTLSYISYITVI